MPSRRTAAPLFFALAVLFAFQWNAPRENQAVTRSVDVHSHDWYHQRHHAESGDFANLWAPRRETSVLKGSLWFLGSLFDQKDNEIPPVRQVEPSELASRPENVHLTWIGHSTLLIRTSTQTILLDPIFSRRASPFSFAGPKREPPLPLEFAELPPIDVVLISHDHYDHCDEATIESLASEHDPVFFVPLGVGEYVRAWGGGNVVEMDWWQYADLDGARYHCVPAKHFSGRGLHNRNGTLWAGWYLELPGDETTLFYAGDTGYATHFKSIRDRLGPPQIAVMPIGAYLPPWLMHPVHVTPEEAVEGFIDLGSDHMIPVHWGTFDLAEEPIHAPADTLRRLVGEQSLDDRVHLLDIGETWVHPPSSSTGY